MNLNISKENVKIEGNNLVIEITDELKENLKGILNISKKLLKDCQIGEVVTDNIGVKWIVIKHDEEGTTKLWRKEFLKGILNISKKLLKDCQIGEVVTDNIGVKWIVIKHDEEGTTKLWRKELLPETRRFDKESNNFYGSEIQKFLNAEYIKYVEEGFGKENLCIQEVDLTSLDGLTTYGVCNFYGSEIQKFLNAEYIKYVEEGFGKENLCIQEVDLTSLDGLTTYGVCKCPIRLGGIDDYRAARRQGLYREKNNNPFWLDTPDSTDEGYSASIVRIVYYSGDVCYYGCDCDVCSVRPFISLKSDIFVSVENENVANKQD